MTRKAPGKRHFKKIVKPLSWHRRGQRVLWHFIMSYEGDGKAGVIVGDPYQLGDGSWLVEVQLGDGRTIRAALESLDEVRS